MSLTIPDKGVLDMAPNEERVVNVSFDADLAETVTIASVAFSIVAISPDTGTSLTKDNESILSASPYNSRVAQLRLIADPTGSGEYDVYTTITTSESPIQRRPRWFKVVIQ
jgi:hypothetical protein